jgi:protein-disulfide isomerase
LAGAYGAYGVLGPRPRTSKAPVPVNPPAPAPSQPQQAVSTKDPFSQRSIGSPTAPVTAIECFSLTCTHCAHFANAIMPQVKPNLIDTGKLQIIYHDFPLDQVALMAAQVARSLDPSEYYPFIEALFASQDDWAFQPNQTLPQYHDLLFKYAALAGMDRPTFDAALSNQKLQDFITNEETYAEQFWHVSATPTFVINGTVYPGAMEYDDFAATVTKAAGG